MISTYSQHTNNILNTRTHIWRSNLLCSYYHTGNGDHEKTHEHASHDSETVNLCLAGVRLSEPKLSVLLTGEEYADPGAVGVVRMV